MIDKNFINEYSSKYDKWSSKDEKNLEEKIKNKLNRRFSNGKIEYITKDIFYDIVAWKAPRVKNKVKKNREQFVKEATRQSFSSFDEQFKIEGLTVLKGVGYRVATAILYFCLPEYTVMDYRAWWTLQQKEPSFKDYKIKDDFEHWQKYLGICKEISKKYGCNLRTLDKALWQYSKENQK